MATTTGGTTYVTSTDLVADYPTASLALANRVDVVASGGPNSIKTSGYTITLADILGGNKFLYNSASPGTFTLPTSGLVDGMVVNVAQIGAGAVTVAGGTIVGTTVTTAQYQGLQFVYASSGTTWYSVAPSVAAPGLAIVTPTSIANSGGSASASGGEVTFTGVTTVSLNGIFTSAYQNYRIIITGKTSTGSILRMRLRAAGTDTSSSNYLVQYNAWYGASMAYESGTATSFKITYWGPSSYPAAAYLDISNPQIAEMTNFAGIGSLYDDTVSLAESFLSTGIQNQTTQFDGLTLIPSTGTITGKIRVYGYKNS